MGDAENAQLKALNRQASSIGTPVKLMSFFYVLSIVHKRIRALGDDQAMVVYKGIYDVQHAQTYKEYVDVQQRVLSKWRVQHGFTTFADYFERQWVYSRY